MKSNFESVWKRLQEECNIKNMAELSDIIGTSQPNVSKKKKAGIFPVEWAFAIGQKYGLSTEWIMTGKEAKIKKKPVEDNYLIMLEEWLKEYTAIDPRNRAMFELTIEKEFPEFKKWIIRKNNENSHSSIPKVA